MDATSKVTFASLFHLCHRTLTVTGALQCPRQIPNVITTAQP
jgi:hypothetical protein